MYTPALKLTVTSDEYLRPRRVRPLMTPSRGTAAIVFFGSSGFLVVIALHEGTHALLNTIGLVRGDFLFIPCSIGVDFGLQLTLDAGNLIGHARWTATDQP